MEAKELRIGNCILKNGSNYIVDTLFFVDVYDGTAMGFDLQPIPLTEEILLKCPNHKRVNGKNILNTIYFEIGRNRVISIGNIGTGNEAIWLCEIDPNIENRITDLVCIHNFDYDGKIMLHKFQNIFHSLTNEELTVNL